MKNQKILLIIIFPVLAIAGIIVIAFISTPQPQPKEAVAADTAISFKNEEKPPVNDNKLNGQEQAVLQLVNKNQKLNKIHRIRDGEYWLAIDKMIDERFYEYTTELWRVSLLKKQAYMVKEFPAAACVSFEWEIDADGTAHIRHTTSPCEAFSVINSYVFDSSGSQQFEMEFTSGSPSFSYKKEFKYDMTIDLEFSKKCEGEYSEGQTIPKTELLGIKLKNQHTKKEATFPLRKILPCDVGYGATIMNPGFPDEPIYKNNKISIHLPSGEKMTVDPELDVNNKDIIVIE